MATSLHTLFCITYFEQKVNPTKGNASSQANYASIVKVGY